MIQLYEYEGSHIQFEEVDGQIMANATLMGKAFGKTPKDWLRTEQAKRYLDAVSVRLKCLTDDLVIIRQGGMQQGTWFHQELVLPFARWLCIGFDLWCNDRMAELMRNGVTSVDGKLGKVMDAISAMANSFVSFNDRLSNLEYGKKVKAEPIYNKRDSEIIDARHRTYQTIERNGGQIRCIKLEDKSYYLMADILMIKGCRTSTGQYAQTLNRSGRQMAVKIWLFAQPREAWFVSEEGMSLLFSN